MPRTTTALSAWVGLLCVPGAIFLQMCSAAPPPEKREIPVSITGYRKWTKVNPKPHRVFSHFAFLCIGLTPEQKAVVASNPHNDKFVTIYVNQIARRAMLFREKPMFPKGSLIVKEKLAQPDSKSPELLTAMYKREKGYNPSAGDWEYLVLNGAGTKVEVRGHLGNCQSCHAQWKKTDYVSRVYFTEAMRRRFR